MVPDSTGYGLRLSTGPSLSLSSYKIKNPSRFQKWGFADWAYPTSLQRGRKKESQAGAKLIGGSNMKIV